MARTILLIDDSVEELRVLVAFLKSADYRLIISNNGADGIQRALAFNPDLILLDVRMPKMDGFATCRLLKAEPLTRDIPIIFLTAANEVSNRLQGLRMGAADFIAKPLVEEEVLLRISIHLKSRPVKEPAPEPDTRATVVDDPQPELGRMVMAACQLVRDSPGIAWSQDLIASSVGTNRKRLSKEFKQAFGTTVMAWVREYRLQLAAQWLHASELSVQAIATDLGFDCAANFATAFKDRFGLPPSEYRGVVQRT